ncbi:MAG TPA: 5'-3' exonuclease H3TH domain-containing protein [Gemmatimonadales bacterium]|nr:5'-3' exonuclease H3TH domain-containing protein [Gemmatimonadales bacterium]
MVGRDTAGGRSLNVHLVDGTYELFRAHFGAPPQTSPAGVEVGATLGLMRSLLSLLREDGVTHVGCAFDHVIESFRNAMYPGYKTSEGVPEALLAQFPLAERATRALGIVVWPMVEFEADDALATAAGQAVDLAGVTQVVICSPDKDLAQCVRGSRVVCLDRRRRLVYDEPAVVQKFGVPPASIPDWLALVGDAADGYPGVPRWGERSATALLARYRHLEEIPDDAARWEVTVRGAAGLAQSLRQHREDVLLYRRLATLRRDVPLVEPLEALRWTGVHRSDLAALCEELGDDQIVDRIPQPHRSHL